MNTNKIRKERVTCQKKVILDYLRSTKSHPTAKDIYLAVKRTLPQISLATVYRNLKILSQKKEILEIESEVSHYDGDISFHAHFICQNCNRIFDIFDLCQNCKIVKKRKIKYGQINGYNLIFYGLCQKCQKK